MEEKVRLVLEELWNGFLHSLLEDYGRDWSIWIFFFFSPKIDSGNKLKLKEKETNAQRLHQEFHTTFWCLPNEDS